MAAAAQLSAAQRASAALRIPAVAARLLGAPATAAPRFFSNVCASTGPDTAGAAIYTFDEYQGLPVYVVHSTFGGTAALANVCSNGGSLGSIGVSRTIVNSLITYNQAIGNGGNPAVSGTPRGGSGGAIYNDGD